MPHLQNKVQQYITIKTTEMVGDGNTEIKQKQRELTMELMKQYGNVAMSSAGLSCSGINHYGKSVPLLQVHGGKSPLGITTDIVGMENPTIVEHLEKASVENPV